MFVLRTGLQGNGKTLNTIKEVDIKAAKEGRQVYYHNIRGFNPGAEVLQAAWEEFHDPLKWQDLPHNAIIVIDESQTFFRIRKAGSAVPEYASALETMRHRGHELHCITQNPGLIDHHFRKLCNSHIHFVRGHKGKIVKRWEFERVNMEVEKRNNFTDGQSTRILLDKKYFGVYQSVAEGSEHHMRFKPPRALFVLGGALLVIGYLGYGVYDSRIAVEGKEVADTVSQTSSPEYLPSLPTSIPTQGSVVHMTTEEYVASRVPRLSDVPSSAPVYDDLTRPVTYPKLSCVNSSDPDMVARNHKRMVMGYREGKVYGCRCNTQQGTRHDVSFDACMTYVENGAFDHARPDRDPQQAIAGTGSGDVGAGTGTAVAVPFSGQTVPSRLTVVNSGKPGHLW